MKGLIAALCFLFAAWLAVDTFGAEAPPDPRLVKINEARQVLVLQAQNAQLSFENAQLKLRELEREEEKIKTEKPKESK